MGSYSSPTALALQYQKTVIDNTIPSNTVVLPSTRCGYFVFTAQFSPLWDGNINDVKLEVQQNDDSWQAIQMTTNMQDETGIWDSLQIFGTLPKKYPFYVRLRVITANTLGAMTCYLMTAEAPPNPLF